MEAGEVKQALCVLKEQQEERSAKSRRCKEQLQCWAKDADRAAIRLSMQSAAQRAGSKELLQHMDGTHEDLFDAVQQLRGQEEEHLAYVRAWLRENQQKDKVLHQQMKKLEEAVAQQEERDLLARRCGFCYWLQMFSLLLVSLELAVSICLTAALIYTLCLDPEFFCCMLSYVHPEQTYSSLVCTGKDFPCGQ